MVSKLSTTPNPFLRNEKLHSEVPLGQRKHLGPKFYLVLPFFLNHEAFLVSPDEWGTLPVRTPPAFRSAGVLSRDLGL